MDHTLIITKVINAPREAVYRAWTQKEALEEWFAPEGMNATVDALDLTVGGTYQITMKDGVGATYTASGIFKEINPPHTLSFSWQWQSKEAGAETLITVTFMEKEGKTEMTFVHDGFEADEQKKQHEEGWTSAFRKLEKQLA